MQTVSTGFVKRIRTRAQDKAVCKFRSVCRLRRPACTLIRFGLADTRDFFNMWSDNARPYSQHLRPGPCNTFLSIHRRSENPFRFRETADPQRRLDIAHRITQRFATRLTQFLYWNNVTYVVGSAPLQGTSRSDMLDSSFETLENAGSYENSISLKRYLC